jgi:uncharacterized membrane protein YedE/YeeE
MIQIILNIISAIIGLQGSTVDPLKDSARLQGLYIALASGIVAIAGKYLPSVVLEQSQAVDIVTALGYVAGAVWYVFGALRATKNTVAGMLTRV